MYDEYDLLQEWRDAGKAAGWDGSITWGQILSMVTSQKKRSRSFAASTLALEAGNKIKYTIVANCMACAHTFF